MADTGDEGGATLPMIQTCKIVTLVYEKFSILAESRLISIKKLDYQFCLLSKKINDKEISILRCRRAFHDVLEGMT